MGANLEVYDVTTVGNEIDFSKTLHGRRQILSSVDEITDDNVIEVLTKALAVHAINRQEELFLKNYERGLQPILHRVKEYNDHINNKIVVNIANQIVTFKTSEFAGEPIMYVTRGSGMREEGKDGEETEESVPEKVARVNSMMLSEGKQTKDYQLAYDMFTCGVGYRLTIHDSGREEEDYLDEAPFEIYIPKAENTFVVRRSDVTRRVLMGVTYVFLDENENVPEYTVYTPNVKYTISGPSGALEVTNREQHNFGQVTLIEYPCNPNYMGAFEPVVPLLDAYNLALSNKLDGIEQFIQALMVFDGVDITREDFLELKDLGAIKLPATQGNAGGGGRKLYYLNEQLDQSQTQTVLDGMYKNILRIVGMPSQGDGNTSDSSNNGAMIIKNGWWDAEARMMETQSMWKEAETAFLKVVLKICADMNELDGLRISDLEPKFWRQSYEDLLVKTQSFSTLRTSGMPAIQAFTFSHLSRDPESDAMVYDEYQQKLADEIERLNAGTEGLPLDENDTVNPTGTEGVVAQAEAEEEGERAEVSKSSRSEGEWAICPVCGKRFRKRDPKQIYDSLSCSNRARRNNGITFGR